MMYKRVFDFLFSLFFLILFFPLLIIIAALQFILSRPPIFFKQQRVGLKGKPFTLYKFRTMSIKKSTKGGSFDAGDTSRVTPIGKVLRKTKIDELPQLWNVLKGDMSLVGPRPEIKKWVDEYPDRWENILRVKPGITDLGSLEFRDEEKILSRAEDPEDTYRNIILPKKLSLYEEYIRKQSLIFDFVIIMKTIYKTVFPR